MSYDLIAIARFLDFWRRLSNDPLTTIVVPMIAQASEMVAPVTLNVLLLVGSMMVPLQKNTEK